jgi:hypothetical protein
VTRPSSLYEPGQGRAEQADFVDVLAHAGPPPLMPRLPHLPCGEGIPMWSNLCTRVTCCCRTQGRLRTGLVLLWYGSTQEGALTGTAHSAAWSEMAATGPKSAPQCNTVSPRTPLWK